MKVALYYNNNDIRVVEQPVPKIKSNEVLVKVKACGICGTDLLEWYRLNRAPLVLGHEIAGEVVEVGSEVKNVKVGQRVAVAHHVPCNNCRFCLTDRHTVCPTLRTTNVEPGGFAQYIRVPALNIQFGLYSLPATLSYEAATFIEPLACTIRAQRKAGLTLGQTVLVLGCGVSGLLHLQLAKLAGAAGLFATDIIDFRLNAAAKAGAYVYNAKENFLPKIQKQLGGEKVDLVILCTTATTAVEQALEAVAPGGTVLFFAPTKPDYTFTKPLNDIFWRQEVKLISTYAANPAEHLTALELLKNNQIKVEPLVTHLLALDEIQQGFKLAAEAKKALKVIINP